MDVNSQIQIHTGPGMDYTQIKQRGWRKENLPNKGEKIYRQKAKMEQIQQEQQHQYTGDIIFFRMQRSSYRVQRSLLGCSVAH
jgi:hypothetical protein